MQALQVDVFLPLLQSFLHPAAPPLQNLHCAHGPLHQHEFSLRYNVSRGILEKMETSGINIQQLTIQMLKFGFSCPGNIVTTTHNVCPKQRAQRPHWSQPEHEPRQAWQSDEEQEEAADCCKGGDCLDDAATNAKTHRQGVCGGEEAGQQEHEHGGQGVRRHVDIPAARG